jgi:hypothetical protein
MKTILIIYMSVNLIRDLYKKSGIKISYCRYKKIA